MAIRGFLRWCVAAPLLLATLIACGGNGSVDRQSITSIPSEWLSETADGWPDSDGYDASMPVMNRSDDCLLNDSLPKIAGDEPEVTDAGWGGLGENKDSYRYICGLHSSGNYAGSVELMQASDAAAAENIVDDIRSQPSTSDQENTVTEETAGKLDMVVVERWYPTNPQGAYFAAFHDEEAEAVVQLEINSLDKADFDSMTAQDAADALLDIIAQGS